MRFLELSVDAFRVLYRFAGPLIYIAEILFGDMIPPNVIRSNMNQSLYQNMIESDACNKLQNNIMSGVSSLFREIKYSLHQIGINSKEKQKAQLQQQKENKETVTISLSEDKEKERKGISISQSNLYSLFINDTETQTNTTNNNTTKN